MEDWMRYLVSMVLVLGAAVWLRLRFGGATVAARLSRRTAEGNRSWQLERAGTLRLSPQHSVHIVKMGERAWLIGCSPGGTALITEVTGSVDGAPPPRENA
jgi:flagellar biogenesis protein FliO